MTFNNEQKQAEFAAFSAYFAEVSKQPFTAARRSLVNNLRSIAVGQFGNAAWQELVRDNRPEPQPRQEVKLGKQAGGGSSRRSQSPGQPNQPKPGSPRDLRLKERAERENRSAAPAVVAGGETVGLSDFKNIGSGDFYLKKPLRGEVAESLIKTSEKAAKKIAKAGATADELSRKQEGEFVAGTVIAENVAVMSADAITSIAIRQTERPVFADAADLSAKELVEKYGRDLIYEYLFNAGEAAENLDQKTDRQLANILKKKVSEG